MRAGAVLLQLATMSAGEPPAPRPTSAAPTTAPPERRRWWLVLAGVIAVLALLAVLLLPGLRDSGRIFAGVRAGPVALDGLSPSEAAAAIRQGLPSAASQITLVDPTDGRTWTLTPDQLGLLGNGTALAEAAYQVGREGNRLAQWLTRFQVRLRGRDVLASTSPLDRQRAEQALAALAPKVDVSPQDAQLSLRNGKLVEVPAVLGHQLAISDTLQRLETMASNPLSTTVTLAVQETAPRLYDLSNVAAAYKRIVSGPVHLVWENNLTKTLTVADLTRWATIAPVANPQGEQIPSIVFDREAIGRWVAPLASAINRPAVDARFAIDASSGKVTLRQPSQRGNRLDLDATVQRIVDAAYTTERTTAPVVELMSPAVTDDLLDTITGLEEVGRAATSLNGSSAGALRNILTASELFQGVTLPPGTEFSFNHYLGVVSAAQGYDMVAIDGSAMSSPSGGNGLGGGISQLVTTAFRTAFWSGLPITQRQGPAYRSGWVEPPVGLDATVDGHQRDLVFKNDTQSYLVIQIELDLTRKALAWVHYGKPDARQVRLVGPVVTDVLPARAPIVRDDPRVSPGDTVQVGWAREGATGVVERVVTVGGQELPRDRYSTRYEAAADVFLVGPKVSP
jgi:vancomycin resistance protein YoaR